MVKAGDDSSCFSTIKIQGIQCFKINWDGWFLSAGMKDSGEVWGLYHQDYIIMARNW